MIINPYFCIWEKLGYVSGFVKLVQFFSLGMMIVIKKALTLQRNKLLIKRDWDQLTFSE